MADMTIIDDYSEVLNCHVGRVYPAPTAYEDPFEKNTRELSGLSKEQYYPPDIGIIKRVGRKPSE